MAETTEALREVARWLGWHVTIEVEADGWVIRYAEDQEDLIAESTVRFYAELARLLGADELRSIGVWFDQADEDAGRATG